MLSLNVLETGIEPVRSLLTTGFSCHYNFRCIFLFSKKEFVTWTIPSPCAINIQALPVQSLHLHQKKILELGSGLPFSVFRKKVSPNLRSSTLKISLHALILKSCAYTSSATRAFSINKITKNIHFWNFLPPIPPSTVNYSVFISNFDIPQIFKSCVSTNSTTQAFFH